MKIDVENLDTTIINELKTIYDVFIKTTVLLLNNNRHKEGFEEIIKMMSENKRFWTITDTNYSPFLSKLETIKTNQNLLYWKLTNFKTKIQRYLYILDKYKELNSNEKYSDKETYRNIRQNLTKLIINYLIDLYRDNNKILDFDKLSPDEYRFFDSLIKRNQSIISQITNDDYVNTLETLFLENKNKDISVFNNNYHLNLLLQVKEQTTIKNEEVVSTNNKDDNNFTFNWPTNKLIIMIHSIVDSLYKIGEPLGYFGTFKRIGGGRSKTLKKKKLKRKKTHKKHIKKY
jgi:hypothetical protein